MQLKTFFILTVASFVKAQDFGTVFNKSSVIVNIISEDQARSYDSRKISNETHL